MAEAVAAAQPVALPAPIPVRTWLPWMLFFGMMLMAGLYFVSASIVGGEVVHEYLHDARHLLGFPCH